MPIRRCLMPHNEPRYRPSLSWHHLCSHRLSHVVWAVLAFVGGIIGFGADVSAQSMDAKACHALLKQAPRLAADCYVRVAEQIKLTPQSSPIDRKQKALLLENAAKSYEQAASRSTKIEERAYLFELSGNYLRQILSEKLCIKVYRCKSIQGLLYQVQQETGYNNVTLLNPRKEPVEVEIRGYQYENKLQIAERWAGALRPGVYTFRATYAGQASRTIQMTLEPRKDQLIYTAPVGVPIPTGAWLLTGAGAAFVAIGATSLAIRIAAIEKVNYERLEGYAKDAREGNLTDANYYAAVEGLRRANDILDTTQPLRFIGWIAVGIGGAAVIGGLVWMFLPRKPAAGQSIANTPALAPPHLFAKTPALQGQTLLQIGD